MNINETTQAKINAVIENEWPKTRAEVAQLVFEGGYWFDEGTYVALRVWDPARDAEYEVATIDFDSDGNLGELEECFGGLSDYIQDGAW